MKVRACKILDYQAVLGSRDSVAHSTQVLVELEGDGDAGAGRQVEIRVWNDGLGGPDRIDELEPGLETALDEWADAHPAWEEIRRDLGFEPRFERFSTVVGWMIRNFLRGEVAP